MASPARQIANIANAQLSTGPRTDDGKSRSSQNARKHGLCAAQLVIAAEDREEFEALHSELKAEVKPQGAIQQLLFDELVAAAWNLGLIRNLEAELTASIENLLELTDNPDLTAKLDRLARHKTRIERTFHRSLHELKALQTDALLAITLPPQFARKNQPLASQKEIAKRTQHLAKRTAEIGPGRAVNAAIEEACSIHDALKLTSPRKPAARPAPSTAGATSDSPSPSHTH